MSGDTTTAQQTEGRQPHPFVSSGLEPQTSRYIRQASAPRLAIGSVVILSIMMVGAIWGGYTLWSNGSALVGVALILGGLLAGLIAALMALMGVLSVQAELKQFREGPLVPGVITSLKPNIVVAMIETGDVFEGVKYAVSQITVRTLGVPDPAVGMRIPCFTRTNEELAKDSINQIQFELMSWGTGDPAALERCRQLLGEEAFLRLESCVKRGPVPSSDLENIMLDPSLEFVGKHGKVSETP